MYNASIGSPARTGQTARYAARDLQPPSTHQSSPEAASHTGLTEELRLLRHRQMMGKLDPKGLARMLALVEVLA